jgi:hypothetical protein
MIILLYSKPTINRVYQLMVGSLVPLTGLEPVRSNDRQILSLLRLPIPPQRQEIALLKAQHVF